MHYYILILKKCQLTSGLHFSAKQGAKKSLNKVEKGVTESDLHRKESFEKVDSSVFEDKIWSTKKESFWKNDDKTQTTQHDDDDA